MEFFETIYQSVCKSTISDKLGSWWWSSISLNGKLNKWNVREYAPISNPPQYKYGVQVLRQKVTVSGELSEHESILGPFFYDNNVNDQSYLDMLNEEKFCYLWFCHSPINLTMETFKEFGGFKMEFQPIVLVK